MADLEKQVEKLKAEKAKLEAAYKRREKLQREARNRCCRIEDELRRLDLLSLVGKPDAVQLAYRECPGGQCYHLNDRKGTLTAVRRSRCTVDFGEAGKWNMLLGDVKAADALQGYAIQLGATA
jgi:hypothetical protein